MEDIRELKLELEGLKNKLASTDKKLSAIETVASRSWDSVMKLDKGNEDFKNKIKNISIKVSEVEDITKKQIEEGGGGGGGLSLNEDELKKMIIANMPYDKIKVFVEKLLIESGGGALNQDKTKGNKKKKSNKGFLFILLLLSALSVGVYKFMEKEKLQTGIMPAGTEFYDEQKQKVYRLTKDKKVTGKVVEENTKEGIVRYFLVVEIKDGKEVRLRYALP